MIKLTLHYNVNVDSQLFIATRCEVDEVTQLAFKQTEDGLENVRDFASILGLPVEESELASPFWPPVTVWRVGRNLAFLRVGDDDHTVAVTRDSVTKLENTAVYWQTLDGSVVYLEDELLAEVDDVLAANTIDQTVTVLLATGEVMTLKPTMKIRG